MSKRSVLASVCIGGLIGLAVDEPEVRVETVTVTEQVEVPGPTVVRSSPPEELPASCEAMIDLFDRQIDSLREYADGIAPQNTNLNTSMQAIVSGDVGQHNRAMTVQYEIEGAVAGPLQALMYGQPDLDRLQEQCEEERSSP